MSFDAVLIANRGEIACRIIRTLKDLGLRSVAVYSDADRDALHVKLADDAIHIGPSPAAESYLNIHKIIEASKQSGAQAIHPGYGFLSENAEFARMCEEAGIVFIGPSANAMLIMGNKAAAKRHMTNAGVPVLPGYHGEAQDDATLLKEASQIGFPIMVKASAGGGGRGMRLVKDAADLPNSISAARAEALSAFGSETLILEKAVMRPRHVEVQIFGDQHGHIIHLGERDCSVQRRHQKVFEEAPCPVMTDDLRAHMGRAAVKAAKSVEYVGAGTVEFLLDKSGAFFFLEMNTRLQVEHPVTELVTGLDLVALQIQVAQGQSLDLLQEEMKLTGHAIEARLYAEDPSNEFLPATGLIQHLSFPDGVRIDSGVEAGDEVSPFYDPMIAKIIADGPDRETARRKLVSALKALVLFGVPTNRQFLIEALGKPEFVAGNATTAFIGETFTSKDLRLSPLTTEEAALAGVIQYLALREQNLELVPKEILGWSSAYSLPYFFQYEAFRIDVRSIGHSEFRAGSNEEYFDIELVYWSSEAVIFKCGGRRISAKWHMKSSAEIYVQFDSANYHLTNSLALPAASNVALGEGDIRAPLHGALTEILVGKGDLVEVGTRLAVVEAMKMQHDILADMDGRVTDIFAAVGSQVTANAPLFKLGV